MHGLNLGLLCEEPDSEAALRFERAGRALGAHVVRIRPSAAGLLEETTLAQTARLMGRLYDALDCEGLAPTTVAEIRRHAGVPVYAGLGNPPGARDERPRDAIAADQDAADLLELRTWLTQHLG